jgi:ABC-2 type transport system ATP-binding protein
MRTATRASPTFAVAPGTTVVRLDSLTKRYRRGGGIEGVSLEVQAGEVFGFLGPNGAGKTTTIRILLDLIRPDSGRVELFGLDARRDGVRVRRHVGYLPGELALYDRLTARELLSHLAHLRRLDGSAPGLAGEAPWSFSRLAERFELELDRPIAALSKGNRQKVGLVQALMGAPSLLVLDEPTSGLDPLVQHQVLDLLREAAERGRTVFLSSHALAEVEQVADRVGMIRAGRLEAVERIDELRARSVHLVDVTTTEPLDPSRFARLPGVVLHETTPRGARMEVAGRLDPVVRELARWELDDLTVREPDLEEVFLAFYEGPSQGDGPRPGAPAGRDDAR